MPGYKPIHTLMADQTDLNIVHGFLSSHKLIGSFLKLSLHHQLQIFALFKRNELLTTETELRDIAKAPIIGLSIPSAANGIPIVL